MIKDNQKYFNRLHVMIDILIIIGSYALAWYLRLKSGLFIIQEQLSAQKYFRALIIILPGYMILYNMFNVYTPRRMQSLKREAVSLFKANAMGVLIFIVLLYLLRESDYSRIMIFIFFGINMFLELLFRMILRNILHSFREKGYNQKHILLVGYSRAAEEFIDRVMDNLEWGYTIRGILDDNIARGTQYKGIKVIGRIDNLLVILPENRLDEIVITLSIDEYSRLEHIVSLCEKSGVHTKFVPDYNNVIPTIPYIEDLEGLPIINIRHVPLNNLLYAAIKRAMDVAGSLVLIVLFSPVMLCAAVVVKRSSPGPIIFKQERVGLRNRNFKMLKFRTMEVQSEKEEKKGWTQKDDPRVTRAGSVMRKTSIDELPQLFNVLKGDMSLVGPRPERPQFVEKFREEIPRYMVKHQVRPGMTGWAQINGYRGNTSIRKRIDYDLYYIENWTLGLDIKILFLTIFKGFINKNAY